ncbi:MAG: pyocin knob domain-containing protein [Desulfovibrio sp.]|nr:pyocin knob domain-containing protein [Desulfovibrio sp.]
MRPAIIEKLCKPGEWLFKKGLIPVMEILPDIAGAGLKVASNKLAADYSVMPPPTATQVLLADGDTVENRLATLKASVDQAKTQANNGASGAESALASVAAMQSTLNATSTVAQDAKTKALEAKSIAADALFRIAKYYAPSSLATADSALDGVFLISRSKAGLEGDGFVFIIQTFFQEISADANRSQLAIAYNGSGVWQRAYSAGVWTAWIGLATDAIATQSSKGLMSATDKARLDALYNGAQGSSVMNIAGRIRVGIENPHSELHSDSIRLFDENGLQRGGMYISIGENWSSCWFRSSCPGASGGSKVGLFSIVVNNLGQGYPEFTGVAAPASLPNSAVALVGYVNSRAASAANALVGGEAIEVLRTLEEQVSVSETEHPESEETGESDPSLELAKQRYIVALNDEARAAIFGGHMFELDEAAYIASTSLYDQLNLTDLATLAIVFPHDPVTIHCMTADGEDTDLEISASAYLQIYRDFVRRRVSILAACREKKREIKQATSEEEAKQIYTR